MRAALCTREPARQHEVRVEDVDHSGSVTGTVACWYSTVPVTGSYTVPGWSSGPVPGTAGIGTTKYG